VRRPRGLAVSSASDAGAERVDRFAHAFVSCGADLAPVLQAVEDDPGCGIAHAYAAMLHMFAETAAAPALARPHAHAALRLTERATENERMTAAAVAAWVEGDAPRVRALHDELAARFPEDLVMLKLGQVHRLNEGDYAGMLRLAEAAAAPNGDVAHFHALRAFPLEQLHLLEEAEAAAGRALELDPDEPWAHHAVAHLMDTRGRAAEGAAFLEDAAPSWERCNAFVRHHNWWHLALHRLDLDDVAGALALYDREVRGRAPDYGQEQAGAAALLVRIELQGGDPGARWEELAASVAARGPEHVLAFLDLHYLVALSRAGRPEAAALADGIARRARDEGGVWADAALPTALGVLARDRGDAAAAADLMERAMPRLAGIGGSHAQRDLFEQLFLDVLIRAGRHAEAQQRLELRRRAKPGARHTARLLAGVYEGLGLPGRAEAMRREGAGAPR
jgi:tetratricopeptide (TPR) repeat protein